jgi:hypothetical protein
MAGSRMSYENALGSYPVGNSVMASNVPDLTLVGGSGEADTPANRLDKNKTVGQLINAGVIERADVPAAPVKPNDAAAAVLKPGESPQVTLTYSDLNTGATQKTPDFIVKQDGTIEATGDPAAANKKDVVIQVERPADGTGNPAPSQQASIDGLVGYLYGRYSSEDPSIAQSKLKLNDQFGLVSNDTAQQVAAQPDAADASAAPASTAAARQNFAPQTQSAMSQGSRFTPGRSGTMSRGDIDNIVPERSQPLANQETTSVADIKNAIAAEFGPDKATSANQNAPYETRRMDRVGTQEMPAVGRYGLTYTSIKNWFADCLGDDGDFDDDNIAGKMDALAKAGKVSKAFAHKFHNKEFAHKFVSAMHAMKGGTPDHPGPGVLPSAKDLKELLPAQLQEQITADLVGKYAKVAPNDAGKVALGFHLGKSPDQLTAAETADAGNKDYMRTANTFASASQLRDGMGANGSASYTVSQDGSLLDTKIKQAAVNQARSENTVGSCAHGVHAALAAAGINVESGNADVLIKNIERTGLFAAVDQHTADQAAAKGCAVVFHRTWIPEVARQWGHNIGHIGIWTDARRSEASDHMDVYRDNNSRYTRDGNTFLVLKSDLAKLQTQDA